MIKRFLFLFMISTSLFAAQVTIINGDGPGEGLNDATPAAPIGGNGGATVGEQRRIALERAAALWGALLHSDVAIEVAVAFDPLPCAATQGVLASAGPSLVSRNWPEGAPEPDTWYPIALANALAERDIEPDDPDISATFNLSLGAGGCLTGLSWYYGLDAAPGPNQIDLVTVALHEFAHGLGFLSLEDLGSGAMLFGTPSVYARFLKDGGSGQMWPAMTNAGRAGSAVSGDVRWTGPKVAAEAGVLSAGLAPDGAPKIYAPNPLQTGSSIGHWDPSAWPDQLMEPVYPAATADPGLALFLLRDLGWQEPQAADLSLTAVVGAVEPEPGQPFSATLTLANDGPGPSEGARVAVRLAPGLDVLAHSGPGQFADGHWEPGITPAGGSVQLGLTLSATAPRALFVEAEVVTALQPDPDSTPATGGPGEDDWARVDFTAVAVLQNDQLATAIEGEQGDWRFYAIDAPVGRDQLNVNAFGGRGDVDLYLRKDALPTLDGYDYRSLNLGNGEWVNAAAPAAGRWYIGVHGFLAFSELNLHPRYNDGSLALNIDRVFVADCPQIRIRVEVLDNGAPATGLSQFAISENGGPDAPPATVVETEPGVYELTYATPAPNGGAMYPRVTVQAGGDQASAMGVFHNCTPEGGAIDVWIDDDLIGYRGAEIVVPVRVEPIEIAYRINSFELDLTYDSGFMAYAGVVVDGALVQPWSQVADNGSLTDRIFIAAADVNNLNLAADQDAVLLGLRFEILEQPNGLCSEIAIDRMVFNNGEPLAITENGRVCQPTGSGSPAVDLALRKEVSDATVNLGDAFAFEITVANERGGLARDLTIADPLPAGLAYVGHSGPGSYDPGTGVWAPGALFANESATLRLEVRAEAVGLIENTAQVRTASPRDLDSTPNNNQPGEDDQDSAAVTVVDPGQADLSLTMTVDESNPKMGETATFTIEATNAGPQPAVGVAVVDRFRELTPGGLEYVSHAGPGAFDPNSGLWTVGDLAVGETQTLTLSLAVSSVGVKRNVAEIVASALADPDSVPDNRLPGEDDQAAIDLTPQAADLSLSVAVDHPAPQVGDVVRFEIVLANAGPDDVSAAQVAAPLPPGLSRLSHAGAGYQPGSGLWDTAVNASSTAVLTIDARVDSLTPVVFVAETTASDQGDPDSTPGNGAIGEDDDATVAVDPQLADLSLTLTADNPAPNIGEDVALTISVANQGPDAASGVAVAAPLPANLEYRSHHGGTYAAGVWLAGDLPAGGQAELTVVVRKSAAGAAHVVAEVSAADQRDPDSTPANGVAGEDDRAEVTLGLADLRLAASTVNGTPGAGETSTLRYELHNDGPDPVDFAEILIDAPYDLLYVSHSGAGLFDPQTKIWSLGQRVDPGQFAALEVEVRAIGGRQKRVVAEIVAAGVADPDSTPANGDPLEDDWSEQTIAPDCSSGATITILNVDGPGEGFNDPRPAAPVGGNPGQTIGEQRLIAFQYAADIWASLIHSGVEITVEANFDNLTCSSSSGILGSAGPKNVFRNFPGAPLRDTWYPAALANSLAGVDLEIGVADLRARFNSGIDNNNGCLANTNWHYGLDANPPGSDIDFVSVLLHEMGHGLGFLTLVNGQSGAKFMGLNDIYMLRLEDQASGRQWSQMSDAERRASAVSNGGLRWNGPGVAAAAGGLTAGVNGQGQVEMYAPAAYRPGSSVSHFSVSLSPNELMEPSYTEPLHDPSLAIALFADLGWGSCGDASGADLSLTMSADPLDPRVGEPSLFTLTVRNDGADDASGVRVRALPPAGLSYQSHAAGESYDPVTGQWAVGDLPAGSARALTLEAAPQTEALIVFSAEVDAADQPDPDSTPGNGAPDEDDYAEASLTPRPGLAADLSLSLAVDEPAPLPGDAIAIMLTAHNRGPDQADAVTVAYDVPDGLTFVSADGAYTPAPGSWAVGAIGAGETRSLTVVATVDRAGAIVNRAQVAASGAPDPDSTPGNGFQGEDDDAEVTVYGQPQFPECDRCARVVIDNIDAPGEGFNDPTPVAPVGGNPGTTLGEQRLIAFQHAADRFCALARSETDIVVRASFDQLACDADSAILGAAAPSQAARDFPGAPRARTWYPAALANAVAGSDLNGGIQEIDAVFNSRLDGEPPSIAPTACDSDQAAYVVERRGQSKIKFEDAPIGLGEDRVYMTDTFVIEVENGGGSVGVSVKAATARNSVTLTGPGDSALIGAQGFRVTLERVAGGEYTFTVTSECNYHALSHIEFDFGSGARVQAPANSYLAPREICPGRWSPDCSDPQPAACLGGAQWYYGLDANPGGDIDFVTTALHELLHGMGYATLVDLDPTSASAGSKLLGFDDIYMSFLQDSDSGLTWDQMTDVERLDSAASAEDLLWTGSHVRQAAGQLTAGVAGDKPRMHAGEPVLPGDTAVHWSPSLTPNPLMEPRYQGANHDMSFDVQLLFDLGWPRQGCIDLRLSAVVDNPSPAPGDTVTVTLSAANDGPRDASGVRVDVSLGGGLGYLSSSGDGAYAAGVWDIGPLANGAVVSRAVTVTIGAGGKSLVAEVAAAVEPDVDSIPANGNPFEDDYAALHLGSADLSVEIAASKLNPAVGELVSLSLTVANDGPEPATGVVMSVDLPAGLTVVEHDGGAFFSLAGGIWDVDQAPAGGSRTLTVAARPESAGSLTVSAEIARADQRDPDSTPANGDPGEDDQDSVVIQVLAATTDLAISFECVTPVDCPAMSARARVTRNGDGVAGLAAGQFALFEDGRATAFVLVEDAEPGLYWLDFLTAAPDGGGRQLDVSLSDGADLVHAATLFAACNAAGCTPLVNAEPVAGLSGLASSWRCFVIELPANQRSLTVESLLGSGDVDLYLKHGAQPTPQDYDARAAGGGPSERAVVDFPAGGRWYIGVLGFEAYCDATLRASYAAAELAIDLQAIFTADCPTVTARVSVARDGHPADWLGEGEFLVREDGEPVAFSVRHLGAGVYEIELVVNRPDGGTHLLEIGANLLGDWVFASAPFADCLAGDCLALQNNQVVAGMDGMAGSWRCFYIDVPANQDGLLARSFDGAGDRDLYLRFGAPPSVDQYDYKPNLAGGEETALVDLPQPGRWWIALQGVTDYQDGSLIASYFVGDLALDVESVSIAECPLISIEVRFTADGAPVTGLASTAAFTVSEDNGPPFHPDSVVELGDGRYRLGYVTDKTSGDRVFINLGAVFNNRWVYDLSEFANCTRAGGAVAVWINDEHGAPAGADLAIPVHVQAVDSGWQIGAIQAEISYDPALLTYLGVDLEGALIEGWELVDDSATTPGVIRLDAGNFTQAALPPNREGVLVYLRFHVDEFAALGECSPLEFEPDAFRFNDGSPQAVLDDGLFCVTAGCFGAIGDVDGDGDAAEAFDALQILLALTGLPTVYDPIPICVADVNCSGAVSLIDATLVLRRAARLIDRYCDGSTASRAPGSFRATVPATSLQAAPGESFELEIRLEELPFGPVFGYGFELAYDPQAVAFSGATVRDGALSERWGEPIVNLEPGRLTIAHVNPYTPLSATGALVKLRGTAGFAEGDTTLTISRFTLAEESEPEQSLAPLTFTISGGLCFDLAGYRALLGDWGGSGVTVRDLIRHIDCLAQP